MSIAKAPCSCGDLEPVPFGICEACLDLLSSDEMIELVTGHHYTVRVPHSITEDGAMVVIMDRHGIVGASSGPRLQDALRLAIVSSE